MAEKVKDTNALMQMGFEVDVSLYTLGDILDLTDDKMPLRDRIGALTKGITKGDIRAVRLKDLPKFAEAISAALNEDANPT